MSGLDFHLDATAHPRRALLRCGRPQTRWLMGRRWAVRVTGAEQVPSSGPIVVAANHIGVLDGPMLAIFTPRPVHALTKKEIFTGRMGRLLRATGQIPVDRYAADPGAVKTSLRVLRDGGAVGIFPEGARGAGDLQRFHHGAAYLALVTGAPVIPVTFVGTRTAGGHTDYVPPRGSSIDMAFGIPWHVVAQPWPRTREQVLHASALLLQHMRETQQRALAHIGRPLPGPLPATERELDPPTGFVERGAT
ncbi:lysophospholipid acyltransferase family protein [Nocardioides sp. LHG3406-4]|uniref:lysophospholipid acyltransferase family protein n=1 Tax=Nocardioides sp. LHG3406-4 TaxID=2804575 RepID=UPI003CF127ED